MQLLGPKTSSFGTTYSAASVQSIITAGVAKERWIWDLLDPTGSIVDDLTPFVQIDQSAPVVAYDTTQAVKRSLTLTLDGRAPLYRGGQLSLDRQIRGHYQMLAPDGGYIDWAIGTFVVLPSGGEANSARKHHSFTGADYSQLLIDYTFDRATSVQAGSAIVAVGALLAIPGSSTTLDMIIPDLGRNLVLPITWDAGTSRLQAVNDILAAINYFPAWFDEMGLMRSAPIPDWNTVGPLYTFDSTKRGSILLTPITHTVDWSAAGNIQTVRVEDPRRTAFAETYVNKNPLSPVSIVNWHPKSLPVFQDGNIPDRQTAQLVAMSMAQKAARVFRVWTLSTLAWPLSQDQDVFQGVYTDPDDGVKQLEMVEMGWSMTCKAGEVTTHTLNELVPA